jgi:hypothetical protein
LVERTREEIHIVPNELNRRVDLVGDTRGQSADRFQLLRMAQLDFQTGPLGDVFHRDDEQLGFAIVVSHGSQPDVHQKRASILGNHPPLGLIVAPGSLTSSTYAARLSATSSADRKPK